MEQVNFFQMFWSAGLVVKFVMLLLLGFSLYSWYIIFQKHLLFKSTRILSADFIETFWQSKDLAAAHKTAQELDLYDFPEVLRRHVGHEGVPDETGPMNNPVYPAVLFCHLIQRPRHLAGVGYVTAMV